MEDSRGWLRKKVERLQKLFLNQSGLLKKNKRNELFLKNGGKLLGALIRSCKDKCRCNLIRSFSAKQVLEATNYFQSHFYIDGHCKWYKGTLDERSVLIKTYYSNYNVDSRYHDIAVSSQMSSHKNALKLLGCCLEFTYPALVYEDIENGPLGGFNGTNYSLSWNMRLKIAKEIANVITYLHTVFDRPIIHRDISLSKFFLDKDYVPKLCDFSDIIRIPEDQTQVKDIVIGSVGYLDPVYIFTETITERTDVYSFGVVLLLLLTGRPVSDFNRPDNERSICDYVVTMVEQERFKEVVDPMILEDDGGTDEKKEQQLEDFLKLALSCIKWEREKRPFMIDVAKELFKIEKFTH